MNPDETPKAVENIDGIQSHMGIVCVLIASMLSGVSAALTQKVLAGSGKQRNSFLLSAELALYGIVFLLLKEIFQSFTTQQVNDNFSSLITNLIFSRSLSATLLSLINGI
jgi:hypothetical protein